MGRVSQVTPVTSRTVAVAPMRQTGAVPARTEPRRWTIATWLVAHAARDLGRVGATLSELSADAWALQSLTEEDAGQLAERLGATCVWQLSHHPRSRLIPSSGLGLAVLTHHRVSDSVSFVTNNHSSPWSKHRRIAHFAVVERDDHSGYTIGHAVGSPDPEHRGLPPAPLVWFRPTQVGVDDGRAVELPDGATAIGHELRRPIEHAPPAMAVTFEMPWVTDGFAGA